MRDPIRLLTFPLPRQGTKPARSVHGQEMDEDGPPERELLLRQALLGERNWQESKFEVAHREAEAQQAESVRLLLKRAVTGRRRRRHAPKRTESDDLAMNALLIAIGSETDADRIKREREEERRAKLKKQMSKAVTIDPADPDNHRVGSHNWELANYPEYVRQRGDRIPLSPDRSLEDR